MPTATIATLPVDVTLISETISQVLASRDGTPERTVCAAWHRRLAGHVHLLAPIAVEQAPRWSDPERTRLVEATAVAVTENLEGGLRGQSAHRPVPRLVQDEPEKPHACAGHRGARISLR
ncbi:hypothetical protein ACQEVM_33425 [Streptomyces sp. CA-243310]|uniref:hypothetical protein n=1 Tax=Streptomyces sp. CA-243310 TaxID=3240056 RepID=UPI003D947E7C